MLVRAVGWRAIAPVWAVLARQAPFLIIGIVLGPVATGLYLLASRLTEGLSDPLLNAFRPKRRALLSNWVNDIAGCMRRAALPAVFGSALLAVALPPLLDLRWWGAVPPAQLLLLGLIPGAAVAARAAALGSRNEARWQAAQAIGGILVVMLSAAHGLVVIAAAELGYTAAVALIGLGPIRRELGLSWRPALAIAGRPLGAALAAALVLYPLAEPVSLALAPIPALCLLGACGRLGYLLAGGEKPGAASPNFAFRRSLAPVNPA
jgi:hypothetical protein